MISSHRPPDCRSARLSQSATALTMTLTQCRIKSPTVAARSNKWRRAAASTPSAPADPTSAAPTVADFGLVLITPS